MKLGKEATTENEKTNPYEMVNKGVVFLRRGAAVAGTVLTAIVLPSAVKGLKDFMKRR